MTSDHLPHGDERLAWLGSIAYASMSQTVRKPANQWDAVSVRAADLLWERLGRRDATGPPFVTVEEARAFADSGRRWVRRTAWRQVERGSKAWNRQRLVDSVDGEINVPQVTLPNDPEHLAMQAEVERAIDEIISNHKSWRVRAVAIGLKQGLTLAEIDRLHGGRASSRAWDRARQKLADEIVRRLGHLDL